MAGSIFATKPINTIMSEASETGEHSLKRALGPVNLVSLGIGAIIGAGIFVLTGAAAVERVLAGGAQPGFRTPGQAFGPQFVFDTGAAVLEAQTASGSAAA